MFSCNAGAQARVPQLRHKNKGYLMYIGDIENRTVRRVAIVLMLPLGYAVFLIALPFCWLGRNDRNIIRKVNGEEVNAFQMWRHELKILNRAVPRLWG